MEQIPEFELAAAADVNPRVLETFRERYGAKTYDSVEKLCADPNVEAVWISTPNRFHAPHTIIAANAGKHVVVEKPMAISLQEAEKMIEASIKNKIKLLCGHTQSFGPHIRTMRKIIRSGELGRLCALHVWAYTDWMLRPRTADELDINQGGGVPYRQGPHQIDTLRLLGGGMVRSVRGSTGAWFKGRPIPGYYSAFMEFEDGTPATLMHNGYGYFLASELVPWGGQNSRYSRSRARGDAQIAFGRHAQRKRRQGRHAHRRRQRKRNSRPQQSQAVAAQRSRHFGRHLRKRRYPPVAVRPVTFTATKAPKTFRSSAAAVRRGAAN